MKIKCISTSAADLPEALIVPDIGLSRSRVFSIILGKEYVVYGITTYLEHLWYYICDECYTYYPVWNPSPLFSIVDNRLSSFWRIGIYKHCADGEATPIIAFDEWVSDPLFYDHLTDGNPPEVATFRKYKALIDSESQRRMT